MKVVSIMMLAFSLLLSNAAMAAGGEQPLNDEAFVQAKTNMLQAVSIHIDVLNKFKTCVARAKVGPELGVCKKRKKAALKALRQQVKQARDKQIRAGQVKNKKIEIKPTKPAQ